ncbi:protein trichome birefringence-like 38 [Chenopodium quinoa]|uniref:protein trichome birefringence-like 38 n=1 Tax=Chenopodium quinoa TaxID=63459 RepID=UPI000B789DA8|nr:protein trichome birefringence-like 38 [Chenopodium quinoa]
MLSLKMGNGKLSNNILHLFIVITLAISSCLVSLSQANHLPEQRKRLQLNQCNIFKGHWVRDASYPMYDSSQCPDIRKEFDCLKYGRTDTNYLKYRWQPDDCDIPRFDGVDFLRRMRGKKIMFIGDSLSLNYYQSLICLLHAAIPNSKITHPSTGGMKSWFYQDYNVTVTMYSSLYLVDIEKEQQGRVMKLNSIKNGKIWKEMDVLVFNTWLWWNIRGAKQSWDYIQDGSVIQKDMDRTVAFRKALMTWAKWVDSEIDPKKTKVFFQGTNPLHYDGKEWNATRAKDCSKEIRPVKGSTYPTRAPPALDVVKQVLSTISKPVYLLDITLLSQLRKDGHPGPYNGFHGMDCNHWCIAGLPDTWNQLLYTTLIM